MTRLRFDSYAEFWPFYLREHARPATRLWHYAGTALVIAFAIQAAAAAQPLWLLAMPVAGYGFAWFSHMAVERNRPATFIHPFWSLVSDFRMFFLFLAGRLDAELRRAGISV